MDSQRQKAFQKIRPPCVQLSSVALQFKAGHVAVREVLQALEAQHQVLHELGLQSQLDFKLAEYAFFPLTHIFNEAAKVSPRCLEVAVQSVTVLVTHGWQQSIVPELGKQLLLLMTLIAGGDPSKRLPPPTDELKAVTFQCMTAVINFLSLSTAGRSVFSDSAAKNIVDQIVFLVAESLNESGVDFVQLAAADVLSEIFRRVGDRVQLASLLPRTVSSLVKALRPSTQRRRTGKVLARYLSLLELALTKVLAGDVVADAGASGGDLTKSWLQATTSQVKNALIQVMKLRAHDSHAVQDALAKLCLSLIEECANSLEDSLSMLLEALVSLSSHDQNLSITPNIKRLLTIRPELLDMLQASFYDWSQSLPRVMQGSDDRPKRLMLTRLITSFNLLGDLSSSNDNIVQLLTSAILKSISATVALDPKQIVSPQQDRIEPYSSLAETVSSLSDTFDPVLFTHQSQRDSSQLLDQLIGSLRQHPDCGRLCRNVVDSINTADGSDNIASIQLAVRLLRRGPPSSFDVDDLFSMDMTISAQTLSRTYLINDLYSLTRDNVINTTTVSTESTDGWRLTALSLEVLVLQAQQLGKDYRNELFEIIYPVLALFGSSNTALQNHAIMTLNLLAVACEYASAKEMLIDNVDYVVNSVAWHLNTFHLSSEAPQVLIMVIRLVGPSLLPYLDDIIASIFVALDNYHGYPTWVERLFAVLKTLVDESAKMPQMALTDTVLASAMQQRHAAKSTGSMADTLLLVRDRKRRKAQLGDPERYAIEGGQAPRRPWTAALDDPNYTPDSPLEQKIDDLSIESLLKQDQEAPLPLPANEAPANKEPDEDPMKPLTRSHDLLLKIAPATVPHLSSPSPQVRHLLLQLLGQIAPLLGAHENTFLPLVNTVWPAVVSRLFAEQVNTSSSPPSSSGSSNTVTIAEYPSVIGRNDGGTAGHDKEDFAVRELPYNIAEAADVISSFCEQAGDFMSTRVEQIWPRLAKLVKGTSHRAGVSSRLPQAAATTANKSKFKSDLVGARAINTKSTTQILTSQISRSDQTPIVERQPFHSTTTTTTQISILKSLLKLLTTILTHVSIPASVGDEIVQLLLPLLDLSLSLSDISSSRSTSSLPSPAKPKSDSSEPSESSTAHKIRTAINHYNPDILWLVDRRADILSGGNKRKGKGWDWEWSGKIPS